MITMWYLSFSDLTSLSLVFSRPIHIAANGIISLFSLWLSHSPLHVCSTSSASHLLIDGPLSCFSVLALVDRESRGFRCPGFRVESLVAQRSAWPLAGGQWQPVLTVGMRSLPPFRLVLGWEWGWPWPGVGMDGWEPQGQDVHGQEGAALPGATSSAPPSSTASCPLRSYSSSRPWAGSVLEIGFGKAWEVHEGMLGFEYGGTLE